MALLFDHVFAFVEPDGPEGDRLEAAGLTVGPWQALGGQGTSSRSVLFDGSFLELVALRARAEAEADPVRLDRRADFRRTGHCPFGIGLRGHLSDEERRAFWPYHPPYFPEGAVLWLHRATTEVPSLPLLFVSEPWPGSTVETMRPGGWRVPRARFEHRSGASGIARVAIEVPDARDWPGALPVPGVAVESGPALRATVSLSGARFERVEVSPHLVLVRA